MCFSEHSKACSLKLLIVNDDTRLQLICYNIYS